MEDNILYLVLGIAVVGIALSYQNWGELAYIAVNNAKASAFVIVCLFSGVMFGLYTVHGVPSVTGMTSVVTLAKDIGQPSDDKVLATIQNCKLFVTASLEGRSLPEQDSSGPSLLHLATTSAPDWDRCARTFGTNYWKHDVSVNGENGGIALCRAYHSQQNFVSSEVETWCTTVFAEENK